MKRFLLAVALSGVLSMTVLAGDIPINGAPAPPPAQSVTVLPGEVPINGAPATPAQSVSAALANVVLTLLLIGR